MSKTSKATKEVSADRVVERMVRFGISRSGADAIKADIEKAYLKDVVDAIRSIHNNFAVTSVDENTSDALKDALEDFVMGMDVSVDVSKFFPDGHGTERVFAKVSGANPDETAPSGIILMATDDIVLNFELKNRAKSKRGK